MVFNNLFFLPHLAFLGMVWLFSQKMSGNPASAAIVFLLALECVMQLLIRLCLKTLIYFNSRLDRDLEIRIQRKLGSDTTTSFLALQSRFNKAV